VRLRQKAVDDLVEIATGDPSEPTRKPAIKRSIAMLWKLLTPNERSEFLNRINPETFDLEAKRVETAKDRDNEEIFRIVMEWHRLLPSIHKAHRGFALSIEKKTKNQAWWPTDKEAAYMKAIYQETKLDRNSQEPEGMNVLEDDDP